MAVSSLFADYLPQDYLTQLPDQSRMYSLWLESQKAMGNTPSGAEQVAALNTIRQGGVPYGIAPLSGVGLATRETLPTAPIVERQQTAPSVSDGGSLEGSGFSPAVLNNEIIATTTTNTPRTLLEAAESGGYIQADPVDTVYEGDNRPDYIKNNTNITVDQYNQFLAELDDIAAQVNLDFRQEQLRQRTIDEAQGIKYDPNSNRNLEAQAYFGELFRQQSEKLLEDYGVPRSFTTNAGSIYEFQPNGTYKKVHDAGEFGIGDFVKLGVSIAVGNALGPLIAGGLSGAVGTTAANIIGSALGSGFATGMTTGFDTDAMLDSMLTAGLTQGTMELLKTDSVRQALNSLGENIGLPTEFVDTEVLDIDGNIIQQGTTTTQVMGLGDTLSTLVGGQGGWQTVDGITKPFFFDKTITGLLDFVPDSVLKALDPYITGRGEQLGYLADFITGQSGGSGGTGGTGGEAGVTTTTVAQQEEEDKKKEEEKDTDGDGIPDDQDTDIDGDGVFNDDDPDPYDPSIFEDTTDTTDTPQPLQDTLEKEPVDTTTEVFVGEDVTDGGGFGMNDDNTDTTVITGQDDEEDKNTTGTPLPPPTKETLQTDKQEDIFVDVGVTDGGGFGMNEGGGGDDGGGDNEDDGGVVVVNQGGTDLNEGSDDDTTTIIGGTVQPPTIGGGGGSGGGMFSLGGTKQSTRPSPFMASISFDPQLLTPLMPKQSKDYLADLLGRLQR